MPAPYRRLARIVKTHGTKGEVSVALRDGISSELLAHAQELWIVPPPEAGAVIRTLTEIRETPGGALVRLSGIESLADAHEIVGRYLLARGEEAEVEAEHLVGYAVIDAERGFVGTVDEIIHTGANDVLVLAGGPFGEVLVPVIPDVIESVDEAERTIFVRLLEGLLPEDACE